MIDITDTIIPKSDQLNADDLITGDKLLEITGVRKKAGDDQPILIDYVGGKGKPYKPCKSMRRVLAMLWGADGEKYIGRKLLVFNSLDVTWAGKAVGGIRIKAMSSIDKDVTFMLTEKRGKKVPYSVKKIETEVKNKITEIELNQLKEELINSSTMADLQKVAINIKGCNYDLESSSQLMVFYNEAKKRITKEE